MQWEPKLPPGRTVKLPGRGTTFVRELPGPGDDAPTVVLLHGWTASADLNWFPSYRPLGEVARVVALDHRGHGRGIRSRQPFRLTDCADDAAALCEVLGIEDPIIAGYSMGGPIAMLTWRRHSDVVAGLVLCATAPVFGPKERWWATSMALTARTTRLLPGPITRALAGRFLGQHFDLSDRVGQWARSQVGLADPVTIAEAGHQLSRFDGRSLLADIDVPTAVIRTMDDVTVPTVRQRRLVDGIPGATEFTVAGDHNACITNAGAFAPALVAAVASVDSRIRRSRPVRPR